MATLGPTITPAGITAPSYADIFAALQTGYWSIYGTDANLDPSSQDGQLLAIFAQAVYDADQAAIAVYNSFSPATAQGTALSSGVKINGLTRQVATSSQAVVTIVGQAGTIITNGKVGDGLSLGTVWDLPPFVTIPFGGTIDETVTCETLGATTVGPGALSVILTPTFGWQSVTNAVSSTPGNPVETDAALRQRQAQSTALPALSIVESLYSSLANVPGVSRLMIYENSTDATDSNGIPSHSISVVVEGGNVVTLANEIALKKTPGTGTYGNVSELVVDSRGVPSTIKLFELALIEVTVQVDIHALPGYTSNIGTQIRQIVASYVNSLNIGEDSYLSRLFGAAGLGGSGPGATFVVAAIRQSRTPALPIAADVIIAFNEAATCALSDVTLTVL